MRLTRMVGVSSLATLFVSGAVCFAQEVGATAVKMAMARIAAGSSSAAPIPPPGAPIRVGGERPGFADFGLKARFDQVGSFEAVPSDPAVGGAHLERADALLGAEDYSRAIVEYTEAIRCLPGVADLFHRRAFARQKLNDLDGAIADETEAIRLDPSKPEPYIWRAKAFDLKNEYAKALEDLSRFIRMEPKIPEGYYGRASNRISSGDPDGAIADYSEIIRLRPKDIYAFLYRGSILAEQGKFDRAVADYEAAIRIDPDAPTAHTQLAWILASCPETKLRDGNRAIAEATLACKLTRWNDFSAVSALAASHAEVGDFDAAKKWQLEAMKLPAEQEAKYWGCLYLVFYTLHYNPCSGLEQSPEEGRFLFGAGVSRICGPYLMVGIQTKESLYQLVWANGLPFFYSKN